VKLGSVADFVRGPFGGSLKKEIFKKEGYLVYEQYHAINNDFLFSRYFVDENKFIEMKRFEVLEGDVLISCSGTMGKIAIVPKNHRVGIINQALLKLTPNKSVVNGEYLKYILESDLIQKKYFQNQNGVAIQNVASVKVLSVIEIPLPPLEVQNQIVAKLKDYQNIISGARQIVENWKSEIDIDPAWEILSLKDICEINPKKAETSDLNKSTQVSFVPMEDLGKNEVYLFPKKEKPLEDVYKGYTYFRENDVLVAKVTPCFENGKSGIAKNLKNKIGFGSSELHIIRPGKRILSEYIYPFISSKTFISQGVSQMTGTGGLQRVPVTYIQNLKSPFLL